MTEQENMRPTEIWLDGNPVANPARRVVRNRDMNDVFMPRNRALILS